MTILPNHDSSGDGIHRQVDWLQRFVHVIRNRDSIACINNRSEPFFSLVTAAENGSARCRQTRQNAERLSTGRDTNCYKVALATGDLLRSVGLGVLELT